jgi:hypothetical protein
MSSLRPVKVEENKIFRRNQSANFNSSKNTLKSSHQGESIELVNIAFNQNNLPTVHNVRKSNNLDLDDKKLSLKSQRGSENMVIYAPSQIFTTVSTRKRLG